MSLLLESLVGASAIDVDGVLSPSVEKGGSVAGFLGRTGYLGDQKGLDGGGDGCLMEGRGFLTGLSGVTFKVAGSDEASSESSSIGVPDDSDEDETGSGDEDEVQSTLSLDDLEASLPSKKGLSGYYGGRSKSFGNLADVKNVNDIQKSDNPFNKRRRNLLAHKLSSWSTSSACSSPSKRRMMAQDNKSAFYGLGNPISMPLLPVHEHTDEDDDTDDMDNSSVGDTNLKRNELQLGQNGESRFCI